MSRALDYTVEDGSKHERGYSDLERKKSKEKASTELSLFPIANWLSETTDILGQMLSM